MNNVIGIDTSAQRAYSRAAQGQFMFMRSGPDRMNILLTLGNLNTHSPDFGVCAQMQADMTGI